MTVKQLKDELRERGLAVSGKKADLLARLEAAAGVAGAEAPAAAPVAAPAVAPAALSGQDVAGLTVAALGKQLVARGLSKAGKKADLVARLREALAAEEDGGEAPAEEGPDDDPDLMVGDRVEVLSEDGAKRYQAVVDDVLEDGSVRVSIGKSKSTKTVGRDRVERTNALRLANLKVGQKIHGVVSGIHNNGVFVDVGAEERGLVRMSRLAERHVADWKEVVEMGQEVDAWVYRLPVTNKLGLSLIEYKPSKLRDPVTAFSAISNEEWLDGRVRFATGDGFWVDVEVPGGAGGAVQGMLIKANVASSAGPLEDGSSVSVRVTRVVQQSGTLYLSMLPPPRGRAR